MENNHPSPALPAASSSPYVPQVDAGNLNESDPASNFLQQAESSIVNPYVESFFVILCA